MDRIERPRTHKSVDKAAAGLESSAMCQWVADLTHRTMKCAYVGIAQIRDPTHTPEPLAEAGRSALDRREWWAYVQSALFTEHREWAADSPLTDAPLVMPLPPQQKTGTADAQHGPIVCVVPISISGEQAAILAVELRGSAPVPPAEVISPTLALASIAAKMIEAEAYRRTRVAQETEALRAALDDMDGVLHLVSHELKAPLTTIMASLQLIHPKVERLAYLAPESPGVDKTLASIQALLELASRCADIEDRMATDLVDASRIRSAKLTLRPRPCDLALVVQESVDALRAASQARIIRLKLPDQSVPVSVDPDRVAQVVANFVGNALKYSPQDSPVEVWVEVLKTRARVWVSDYGPGLEKSELKRVWRRFYRVGGVSAHSATGSGLGLGLYIAREIIRGHGGSVGVRSVPGRGATFWFTLPLATTA